MRVCECVCVCVCVCVLRDQVCVKKKKGGRTWCGRLPSVEPTAKVVKRLPVSHWAPRGIQSEERERVPSTNTNRRQKTLHGCVCVCVCGGGADRLILIDFSLIGFSSSVRSKSETSAVLRTKSEGYEKKIEKKNNFFCFKCAAIAPCFKKKSKGDVFGNRWKS